MTKPRLILMGGGGHCKSVIDVVREENQFEIAGILDVPEKLGREVLGVPCIGTDERIHELAEKFRNFVITMGHLGNPKQRKKLFTLVRDSGGELPPIVSPRAYISRDAYIGMGTVVFHNSAVNASARIGINCILNTGAIVDHDTTIDNNVHISTRAVVNGQCQVGEMSFVGSGAVLAHGVCLGRNNIIGAGSVVLQDTPDNVMCAGVPAKMKKSLTL